MFLRDHILDIKLGFLDGKLLLSWRSLPRIYKDENEQKLVGNERIELTIFSWDGMWNSLDSFAAWTKTETDIDLIMSTSLSH